MHSGVAFQCSYSMQCFWAMFGNEKQTNNTNKSLTMLNRHYPKTHSYKSTDNLCRTNEIRLNSFIFIFSGSQKLTECIDIDNVYFE